MIRITEIEGNIIYTELTTEADVEDMERTYEKGVELLDTYENVHLYEDVLLSGRDLLSMHTKTSQEFAYGDELDLGRVAVVGGGFGMELLVKIWKILVWPLVPQEARYFDSDEADTAREWIQHTK